MISIVIPAYNEEKSVKNVIGNIREVLAGAGISGYEIIVVDDCSTDSTFDTALSCGVRVVRNLNNIGYGFSLKHGIREAANDTILIMDCDETYPPETIPPLIRKYQEGFHLVVGQRTGTDYNPTLTKTILRLILSGLIYYTSGKKSADVNSGMRVFSKADVLPIFSMLSNTFSFTTSQTLIYTLNCKFIHYLPIVYLKRTGETKVKVKDIFRSLQHIFEIILIFNPLKIYLLFIVPLALADIISGALYFAFRRPLMLSAGIVLFLSVVIFAAVSLLSVRNKFSPHAQV